MAVLSEEVHEVQLGQQRIPYLLRRGQRRTMGLTIDASGLRLNVPQRATMAEIRALLETHRDWILAKLAERHVRLHQTVRVPDLHIAPGAWVPVLGRPHELKIRWGGRALVCADGCLELHLPEGEALLPAFFRGYQKLALRHLGARIELIAPLLGVPVPALGLTNARTRWGSCSASGRVRLHWKLYMLPAELLDYVVIHELAHLLEMNHSTAFWDLVERLCPNWRTLRKRLKSEGARLPALV